jgi:two-component system, NarL family, sensor histidine kinase DesK
MPNRATRGGRLSVVPGLRTPGNGERRVWSAVPRTDPPPLPTAKEVPGVQLARAILITVLCGYLVVELLNVVTPPLPAHGLGVVVGCTAVVLLFSLQLFNSSAGAARWPMRRRVSMLVAQALVTYLPLLVLGELWGGMAGFLAGSVLLLAPVRARWALFAAIAASLLVTSLLYQVNAAGTAYYVISTVLTGLVVFGLTRLADVIRYVHATRSELAQMAIANERMRFARDLHDLLGYSLSAITLKVELTRRLVTSNPGRARDEIAEVLDIARQALADVRLVASGYRNISLAKEASAVASLLSAAGIDANVEITCGALEEKVDTVLATVLREAVTNTLRHSSVRHCSIEAGQVGDVIRLQVVNDGVSRTAPSDRHGGGLDNLAVRLQAIGGRLKVEVRPDGWFDLVAEAPLQPLGAAAVRARGPVRPGPDAVAGAQRKEA